MRTTAEMMQQEEATRLKEVAESIVESPTNQRQRLRGEMKRKRLVSLLRGYFATPVIATLGETGMAERMYAGAFSASDWEPDHDTTLVAALLDYLHSIGLIERTADRSYALTPEGRTVVARNGASSLLMSYADYFHMLPDLLAGRASKPYVNRLRNVRGSGQLHSKKFFPAAFDLFSAEPPLALIDVGCGDGCFLEFARERWPGVGLFGVDLSETAVETTKIRLGSAKECDAIAVTADGHDVASWSAATPSSLRNSARLVISMWFVAHEFSQGSPQRLKVFFRTLRDTFPQATLVLGEITHIPPDVLASNYELSIMPEFLLFHALSGQGVLSWPTWKSILEEIPYRLSNEQTFDLVCQADGEPIPASFIWHLAPR